MSEWQEVSKRVEVEQKFQKLQDDIEFLGEEIASLKGRIRKMEKQ
jgi:peptidoglycan hydrolase CwlO-like protein